MTQDELISAASTALRDVPDPETGINIVDLGLIYSVEAEPTTSSVKVTLTFTSPACPAGAAIVAGIERCLARVGAIQALDIDVTFEPPWTPELISAEGRKSLGMDE